MTASGVFLLVGGRKNTTSAKPTKTPPAQVAQCQGHLGHKYRSGMQQPNAVCTRAPPQSKSCPRTTSIWLLHPAPMLVPKMVLTLCNLRWWCFSIHQLAKYSTCSHGWHHLLQLALVVFFLGALAHLLMCAQTNRHSLQLALWWWYTYIHT